MDDLKDVDAMPPPRTRPRLALRRSGPDNKGVAGLDGDAMTAARKRTLAFACVCIMGARAAGWQAWGRAFGGGESWLSARILGDAVRHMHSERDAP